MLLSSMDLVSISTFSAWMDLFGNHIYTLSVHYRPSTKTAVVYGQGLRYVEELTALRFLLVLLEHFPLRF